MSKTRFESWLPSSAVRWDPVSAGAALALAQAPLSSLGTRPASAPRSLAGPAGGA
jgi:hypothetical protein